MAYEFNQEKASKFQFKPNLGENTMTINGINSSIASAATICDGVNSLMAIGSNTPYYDDGLARRTVNQYVVDNN